MIEKWVRAVCSHCGESFTYAALNGWPHTGRRGQTVGEECPGRAVVMESELRVYDSDSRKYHIFGEK